VRGSPPEEAPAGAPTQRGMKGWGRGERGKGRKGRRNTGRASDRKPPFSDPHVRRAFDSDGCLLFLLLYSKSLLSSQTINNKNTFFTF